jgi:hypothetical protein
MGGNWGDDYRLEGGARSTDFHTSSIRDLYVQNQPLVAEDTWLDVRKNELDIDVLG